MNLSGHERVLAAASAASDDSSAAGALGEAFGWGVLSASSLVFGAGLGIVRLPSKVVRASLMAFGGGALIEALSIELFAHIIAKARGGHGGNGDVDRAMVFLAVAAAVMGGLLFAALDRVLNEHGAFLRKTATLQAKFAQLRYALIRRLIARLRLVPMFEVLPEDVLQKLVQSMTKVRYKEGAVIFNELSSDSSVFFLLSGRVELVVTTRYWRGAHSADEQDNPEDLHDHEVKDRFMLGPNDVFGEMALFTAEPVEAQAVACIPSCALRISSSALHKLLASNRRMQDFVAMTAIDRLRETEVFRRCTPSTVARLVSFMKQAEYEAGDVLFFEIDAFSPIYFVVLGAVELLSTAQGMTENQVTGNDDGKQLKPQAHVCHENELLGTDHLMTKSPVARMARAVERTTVLVIQRRDIDSLCERDERFRQALLHSARSTITPEDIKLGMADEANLVPPEGMAPPSAFSAIKELGWRRQEGAETPSGRQSPPSEVEEAPTLADDELGEVKDDPLNSLTDLPDILENAEAAKHHGNHGQGHGSRGVQAAIMIWLGILIDAVPESVVMGILVNSATTSTLVTFVCGVFLANFPEAMSSAGTMYQHGLRRPVILAMWGSITLLTGVGALVGAAMFPPGSIDKPGVGKVIACIEGLCGGAMLCMIANTVLPEAFEQGGNVTGLSTLFGFLLAISVSVIQ